MFVKWDCNLSQTYVTYILWYHLDRGCGFHPKAEARALTWRSDQIESHFDTTTHLPHVFKDRSSKKTKGLGLYSFQGLYMSLSMRPQFLKRRSLDLIFILGWTYSRFTCQIIFPSLHVWGDIESVKWSTAGDRIIPYQQGGSNDLSTISRLWETAVAVLLFCTSIDRFTWFLFSLKLGGEAGRHK